MAVTGLNLKEPLKILYLGMRINRGGKTMRLRIVRPVKDPEPFFMVLKEKENHQYQFFGRQGFLGRSPCRGSVKKLVPKDVMNRAEMCTSDFWEYCNLVDGRGKVLDTMNRAKAHNGYLKDLYSHIAFKPSRVRLPD
jgi:hypothetical protein